ncbi:MAG: efflux RND transporter periplasmic adaptor subunit [Thiohalomonadales bacterium]|nr:efflux RND transporter periplasmic adaptor subunit [Thiohalomonadales bacterium]
MVLQVQQGGMRFSRFLFFVLGLLIISDPVRAEVTELATAEAFNIQTPQERILDAVIEAVKQATVSAQTSGRVIEINYDVDDYVEKGSILLRFRDKEQRARYNAAQANFEEAQSDFKRTTELFEKKLVAKAMLDKAEARLKAARAERDQAKENLEHTIVRAPYSGIVVQRHIEIGETAAVGQKLFTGISLESLRATVNVPQDIVNTIRSKQKASVILDRDNSKRVPAESLTISPFANPVTHTFTVRVNLPVADYQIYPGMFVKVAFTLDEIQQLVVPVGAVSRRSEVSAVYVVDEKQQVHYRQVRVGRQLNSEQVVILAGLTEGERVALDPIKAVVLYKEQQAGVNR